MLSPTAPITARHLFGFSPSGLDMPVGAAFGGGGAMAGKADEVRLETERLILRPYGPSDHDALHRIFSDPAMFRFSHRGPMTTEESWSLLLRQIGHWAAFGHGVFAVIERASGALIGETGLSDYRRKLGPDFDPVPEMTWSVLPHAQGRGYAAEAAAEALVWAGKQGVDRTVCLIHERNEASLTVAEKLGYRPLRTVRYRGYPALLFDRVVTGPLGTA